MGGGFSVLVVYRILLGRGLVSFGWWGGWLDGRVGGESGMGLEGLGGGLRGW